MGKGGVTRKIEETIAALEKGQLKNALYLTDRPEMARARGWVEEAARKALADKKNARKYMNEAKDKLQATVTLPLDDTSLEGVEEYLNVMPSTEPKEEVAVKPKEEMTDEEMYENCDVCHLGDAAVKFGEIAEKDECDGAKIMEKLQPCFDNQETTPETWLKTMTEVTEQATCNKSKYGQALGELMEYLHRKDSEILKTIR